MRTEAEQAEVIFRHLSAAANAERMERTATSARARLAWRTVAGEYRALARELQAEADSRTLPPARRSA